MTFVGRWNTSFGPMNLTQDGARVRGTYGPEGSEHPIEGTVTGDVFSFRYVEPREQGTGWFRLRRPGFMAGEYLSEGGPWPMPWRGWSGFDGLWDTHLGRVRFVQDATGLVVGLVEHNTAMRLEGRCDGDRLAFTLHTSTVAGRGTVAMDTTGLVIEGEWQQDGQPAHPLIGKRVHARPGLTWLVVLEAYWQQALEENEFAFGNMLGALFARVPRVKVRHRFFHDEASLLHWCRQLTFLADPAVLMIAGHGEPTGMHVNGRIIPPARILGGLRLADTLQLLHFSSCLVGQEGERLFAGTPFPVSGYTTSVDWAGSALTEFVYLDLMLEKGLPPPLAAQQLVSLVRFAGSEEVPGSPYRPAGFCFFNGTGGT